LYFSIENIPDLDTLVEETNSIKYCIRSLEEHPEIENILFDLSKTKQLNSGFFGLLLNLQNTLNKKNSKYTLKIVNPSDVALKIMQLLKLDKYFEIENYNQGSVKNFQPFYIPTGINYISSSYLLN
jgi:anti-anti-sigma regulatory factor